jgi:hypothetical protein
MDTPQLLLEYLSEATSVAHDGARVPEARQSDILSKTTTLPKFAMTGAAAH